MDLKIRQDGFFVIPNYENYVIDPQALVIFNLKNKVEILPVKTNRIKKYKLSKNGNAQYITLFQILKSVIETYF